MDYELKYVIAICLLVKIAALSPEFPIGEKTGNPMESPGREEAPQSPPPPTQATVRGGRPRRGRLFDWRPGHTEYNGMKGFDAFDVAEHKQIRENERFDGCEHKLELLENSLNWRDIRKTLHWLDRILASNQTDMKLCRRRKESKRFHTNLKQKHFKKVSTHPGLRWGKKNSKTNFHKTFKKGRTHKHRSWKNRLRGEKNKKEKVKSKRKKSPFAEYFQKKDLKFSPNNAPALNTTILKPNSVLFDVEKILFQRTKTKGEKHIQSRYFGRPAKKKCGGPKCTEKENGGLSQDPAENNKAKMPKQKPWPHFVYHRVSSNFLHPDSTSQNHKQSAYIAISVVTSGKPGSTDNNEKMSQH